MKVKVTQEHIKRGRQEDTEACAVALAVKAVVKRNCRVEIEGDTASLKIETNNRKKTSVFEEHIALSSKVQKFIEKFDWDKDDVKPMEFDLNADPVFLR